MKDAWKKGSVLALALALLFLLPVTSASGAAAGIDGNRTDGSITFEIGTDDAQLAQIELPIDVYRVAGVTASGGYTALAGFEDLKLPAADDDMTAEAWRQSAKAANAFVEEKGLTPDETIVLNRKDAANTAENLQPGLYLIAARTVQNAQQTWSFAPYLLPLPFFAYDAADASDGEWVYQVKTELKPDLSDLYGDLEITKTLHAYNQTLGNAFFVFQVEAVKEGKKVYSGVVSVNFDGPGQKSILVSRLPAGAEVTVTEVYSGASYTAVAGTEQKTWIVAEGEDGHPAGVSFQNTYDDRLNSSTGIVNQFRYENGTWDWQKQTQDGGPGTGKADGTGKNVKGSGASGAGADVSFEQETKEAGAASVKERAAELTKSEETHHAEKTSVQTAGAAPVWTEETNVRQDGGDTAPQASAKEDAPEQEARALTESKDGFVPLSGLIGELFSDENASRVTGVFALAALVAFALAFGLVRFIKYRRNGR